ncbi:helix-turn-helix domain-containing protein [Carboxylicivirga sp. M1479]|uniref:helix-turn-helix domain-containing protein n=1 Tax=Carboxylicivirga sp. M1479 TaxID=2594476 RepID=UPI0011789CA4|nr:helix-turn-helix domain-containing protein [Carboxylicivirga sp. M1479]TRX71402.1 helix-turn-helix domain-containing protein [Carboxylicivirga sp. M1479]
MSDKDYLSKVREVVLSNLGDEDFGVNELAQTMGISRSQLFRNLKRITHHSANVIIRDIRLEEALALIKQEQYTFSEVAYKVGFSSPSYFNKCFHDKYGCAPSEYLKIAIETIEDSEDSSKKGWSKKYIYPMLGIILLVSILIIISKHRNSVGFANTSEEMAIAVLPFLDLSQEQDRHYIAAGITDAIILELSKINNLRVVSRGSAEYAQDSIKLYPNIAKKLGVNLILEGSIVYNNDSLRVNVQLIQPLPQEKHMWASIYEQGTLNIMHLSNSISKSVADEIQMIIIPEIQVITASDVKPEVFDSYLKAKHLWQQQSPQSLQTAVTLLNQTIKVDPNYAPAYSLLAECYISLNKFIRNNEEKLRNRQEGRQAIDRALERAIELDGSLAEAYITKGNILGKFDYNWEGMKSMVEKGLELNSNNAAGYIALSYYYAVQGELEQSIKMALKAEQLDPLNPRTCSNVAKCYTLAGQFNESLKHYTYVLEMFPSYGFAWDGIGYAYYMLGEKDKAIESWTELHRFIGNDELVSYYESESFDNCIAYWLGKTTSGEKLFCSNPVIIAMVHLFINDQEGALEYIEFAYKYKDLDLPFTVILPNFSSLYDNPRFIAITEQIGVDIAKYKSRNL